MNNYKASQMNRRAFLGRTLGAVGSASLLAPAASAGSLRMFGGPRLNDNRTLVVVQLSGGNDGLSTIVPYGDDQYHLARKSSLIATGTLRKIDEYRGFHPNLAKMATRYEEGGIGIVQGVGYPGPTRSHFKAREIWHTANLRGRAAGNGWLGNLCDQAWPDELLPELSVHIGQDLPYSLHSDLHAPVVFNTPETYRWLGDDDAGESLETAAKRSKESVLDRLRGVMTDAKNSSARILDAIRNYETPVEYTGNKYSQSMKTAAALIESQLGSRVLSVVIGGFDNHAAQKGPHGDALKALDYALDSFLADVQRSEAGRNTMVLVFSEFGRRVKENGSGGTDHGKAGLMFLAGGPVKGGLYGKYPSLKDLDDKDLRYNVDFRGVYATAINWIGGDAERVIGANYYPLPYLA